MKTKYGFLVLSLGSFLVSTKISAEIQADINMPLAEDSAQMEFLRSQAPIVFLLDYKPGLDKVSRLDYVKAGHFDTQRNASFASQYVKLLDKKTGEISVDQEYIDFVESQESVIYSDYFETGKFVGLGWLFYRPLDIAPDHFHFHDGESAVVTYEKANIGSSLEDSSQLDGIELMAAVANSHGEALVAAGSKKYLDAIIPDFSKNLVFWTDDPIIRAQSAGVKIKKKHPEMLDRSDMLRLVDSRLDRVAFVSASSKHPVTYVSDMRGLLNEIQARKSEGKNIKVLYPKHDKESAEAIAHFFEGIIDANEIEPYQIELLAPIVRQNESMIFGEYTLKDEEDPKSGYVFAGHVKGAHGPTEDWEGNTVDVMAQLSPCMRNPEGLGMGANPYINWAMSCQVSPKGERVFPQNKKEAGKIAKRINWVAFHEVMKEAFWMPNQEGRAYTPVYNPYLDVQEDSLKSE